MKPRGGGELFAFLATMSFSIAASSTAGFADTAGVENEAQFRLWPFAALAQFRMFR